MVTYQSILTPISDFSYHLKLQPCSRQMVQYISWSQGCSTNPLISKSILWTSIPVWTVPDSIIRLPSLLLLLSSSVCNSTLYFALQSPKWLSLAITLQPLSYCLEHSSIRSHISVTRWLIHQMLYNAQEEFIKEAIHLWGLSLVQFNLAK